MRLLFVLAATLCASCTTTGPFVWVHDYKDTVDGQPTAGYVIAPGDTLSIRVWNQEAMGARARVREDGKISLPFLKDVVAAGFTPDVLSEQLAKRLKDYINTPVVTVSLEEPRPFAVAVIGEVANPGTYQLAQRAGILTALAAAGGLTEFAHQDRIFVVRKQPSATRIRVTYESLSQGEPRAVGFQLRDGDAVVVE